MGLFLLKSIESLRIIAALLVVLAHIPTGIDIPFFNIFGELGYFSGAIGVDIFFVISGFVMGVCALRCVTAPDGPIKFLSGRVFRVFPLYILLSSIMYLVGYFLGKSITLKYYLESLILIPQYENDVIVDPLISLGWTLRFEMYFYLMIFISLIFRSIKLLPCILILGAVILNKITGFYYGASIVIEFLMGYYFALYHEELSRLFSKIFNKAWIWVICILIVCIFLFAARGKDFGYPLVAEDDVPRMSIVYGGVIFPRWICWGLPSFLLVFIAISLERKIVWPFSRFGQYTYSIYLLQYFAFYFLNILVGLSVNSYLALTLFFIFLFISAFFSHRFVELPMVNLGKKFI